MTKEPNDPKYVSKDFLETESTFDSKTDPTALVEFLRRNKTTGKVTMHVNQGGIQRVFVTERSPVKLEEE